MNLKRTETGNFKLVIFKREEQDVFLGVIKNALRLDLDPKQKILAEEIVKFFREN